MKGMSGSGSYPKERRVLLDLFFGLLVVASLLK